MLRRSFIVDIIAIALVMTLAVGCSKPTHESIAKDANGKLKELLDVLKTVKDDASAKVASVKIKEIGEAMNKLEQEARALPKRTPEEEKAVKAQMESNITAVSMEWRRIRLDHKLDLKLNDALRDLTPAGK